MPTVGAFLFDAYGTLFDVHSVIAECRRVTAEAEALSQLWRSKQLEYTWLRALMGRYEDFWSVTEAALRFATRRLNLRLDPAQHTRLLEAYLRLDAYPEVAKMVEALRGTPLAILSNGSPRMLQAVVEHTGLGPHLAHVLSADEVRTYKPSPVVYALGPKHLGVPKERIVFVSSNSFDVVGARAFGFRVCWVNRAGAPLDELGVVPDATVSRLDEMPQALGL
ncbi:MAG TPA: haloacid dehalogenase type II [Candidatus Methylomirabilis sp.]|jgi:2-haloacid dehalogenase|nr:haloacid dehalogenase type II [Candidatus Methylomirabilis sp.]